ncbi:VOC family protein [Candidatus Parcubacteria bacterium]|nr:VOC family protein [Candidatus Parcubacteria bacterium]
MTAKMEEQKINMRLDHIAYAVKSTDETIKVFSAIYPIVTVYKCLEKNQNVFITYLSNKSETHKIELVEPAGNPNPVENILKSKDAVLYHLCYRVENFKKAIRYIKECHFFMVTAPFKTSVEKNMWACHFFNPKCGIIEIIGENKYE